MKIYLAIMILAFGASGHLFSQSDGYPVPPNWLRDGRLHVPEYNLSIASPNPDSQWRLLALPEIEGKKATALIVDASPDESYILSIWEMGGRIDARSTKQYIEGMEQSLPQDWIVHSPEMQPSTIPTKDSIKFHAPIILPDDLTIYAHGYVVGSGSRTYQFFTFTESLAEPENFKQFVSSFSLIAPDPISLSASENPASAASRGMLLLLSIIGLVLDLIYRAKGGKRPTPKDRRYLLIATLVFLALIIFAGILGATGYVLGKMSAYLLILLFAGWELQRLIVRHKYPLPRA